MDIYGTNWVTCRPTDSILRHTHLRWVNSMPVKALNTSAIYFGVSIQQAKQHSEILLKAPNNRQ